jgi:PPK2 family polyphosphate:nucleotide phosphotransferase
VGKAEAESVDRLAPLRVAPGKNAQLSARDPGDQLGLADKVAGTEELDRLLPQIDELHDRLWAEATRSVLLVLQGMDASGKDGTIRKVLTGLNPQGCSVAAFKAPSENERAHDYLRRVHEQCPPRGKLGVFNRSHYEDVVAARLIGVVDDQQCAQRYRHIREFERMLVDEGTTVVKVFLHISRDEQRARLQARLDDPNKRWKFRVTDLDVRAQWDGYQAAYERALTETSTEHAPWWVVPADHKWVRDVAVAQLLLTTLRALDPRFPPTDPALDDVVVE